MVCPLAWHLRQIAKAANAAGGKVIPPISSGKLIIMIMGLMPAFFSKSIKKVKMYGQKSATAITSKSSTAIASKRLNHILFLKFA